MYAIRSYYAELAKEIGADAISHGCTGKGNDQFRFESVMRAKTPEIEIIAPIRDLNLTRTEEIQYAKEKGIPIPVNLEKPFSIDENLWGRSIEGGILENPMTETPKECFAWTVDPTDAQDKEEYVEIEFKAGVPVAINGQKLDPISAIKEANNVITSYSIHYTKLYELQEYGVIGSFLVYLFFREQFSNIGFIYCLRQESLIPEPFGGAPQR